MNEKQAIDLLIRIAERQQQIIKKLAVMTGQDPNIAYLTSAIPTAAANAGINNAVVTKVDTKPASHSDNGARMESGYIVSVSGIPSAPKLAEVFKMTWDKQLAAQKPDLVGRVSLTFV